MIYTIAANENIRINLKPETVIEEVLQNLNMILSTVKGSAPLDRNFGIGAEFIDKPLPVAESLIIADIWDAFETYEPRASIVNITFDRNVSNEMAGKVVPRVEVTVNV